MRARQSLWFATLVVACTEPVYPAPGQGTDPPDVDLGNGGDDQGEGSDEPGELDDDAPIDVPGGQGGSDDPASPPGASVEPGGACACDDECVGDDTHAGLCIHGICGTRATSRQCTAGSRAECPEGQRCWSGTGDGVCYPDFVEGACDGERDGDGSCVSSGGDCYASCGTMCDRPGEPPGRDPAGGEGEGEALPEDDPGDGLGACDGTAAECEAARVINEYRVSHQHAGECSTALRWNSRMGEMAHAHQDGPHVGHSDNGYVECVGQAYGVRETAEYIVMWEAGIEEHCAADGSYVMSHHCATMYCNNVTIGVGVYEDGDTTYMTMMFGDENGDAAW